MGVILLLDHDVTFYDKLQIIRDQSLYNQSPNQHLLIFQIELLLDLKSNRSADFLKHENVCHVQWSFLSLLPILSLDSMTVKISTRKFTNSKLAIKSGI